MISNINIASYADDNTSYISADNIDDLIKSLEEASVAAGLEKTDFNQLEFIVQQ